MRTTITIEASLCRLVHAAAVRAGVSPSEYVQQAALAQALADARLDRETDPRSADAAVFQVSADWTEWRVLTGDGRSDHTSARGLDWVDAFVHPDDRDRVSLTLQDAIATADVFDSHHRAAAGPSETHVHSRGLPLVGCDGRIIEWLCVVSAAAEAEGLDPAEAEGLAPATSLSV